MEDLVKMDAEDAFFIEEPSHATDPERPRRGLGLLPFVVAGFGLACTLGLAAAIAVGVQWRMDELQQPIASPADIAPPPAAPPPAPPSAEPTEPPEVVPTAELAPEPEPVAPPAPAPAAPAAPAVRPAAPAEATAGSNLARVESLSVEAAGASRLRVKCGGVSATGTESVRIADFPAGFCTVEVHQFDDVFRMGMGVEETKSLRCGIEEGVLRCS